MKGGGGVQCSLCRVRWGARARVGDVLTSSVAMIFRRVEFGEEVGQVGRAGLPNHEKMALADAVPDPMVAHVNGFGAFLFHGVVSEVARRLVVGDNWCWWLWVP